MNNKSSRQKIILFLELNRKYINKVQYMSELLWSGKEQEIKSSTTYKSYDSNIDDKDQVRDIGIMMSNTATFTLHIKNLVKKERDKMGWVLRVFQSSHAGTPEISCIPLLEYCCHLWNPWKAKDIQAIDSIQQTFTYKITEVQHLKLLGKTVQTQIVLSPETQWTL